MGSYHKKKGRGGDSTPVVQWATFVLLGLLAFSAVLAGPLNDAAKKGDLGEIRRLIQEGMEVNATDKITGDTPLHAAARWGHTALAEMLIDKGAEIDTRTLDMETPLDLAVRKGHQRVANLLKKHGAKERQSFKE